MPMAGFPIIHLNKHLATLVHREKQVVAMCEEIEAPTKENRLKLSLRRVTRVITPGTLLDESFITPYENNFLLAVSTTEFASTDTASSYEIEFPIGLAWIDVSTGELFSKATNFAELRDELARIAPKEVILPAQLTSRADHPVVMALQEENMHICRHTFGANQLLNGSDDIVPDFLVTSPPTSDLVSKPTNTHRIAMSHQETLATSLLTVYLKAHLREHMPSLDAPSQETRGSRMQIDNSTIKALEIREGIREGGSKGSLMSVIKRTKTAGGARLLTRWLCA